MDLFYQITVILNKKPNVRDNTYEILLEASPEFAVKHDDNLSFYSDMEYNDKVERIKKEAEKFREAVFINNLFLDRDHIAVVNVEGDEFQYRNIDEIIKDINFNL